MQPHKLLFLAKVLFCLVVVSTEGKKKKARKTEEATAAPAGNLCDIYSPEVIYCYCDNMEVNEAEEGNCWIFSDTSEHERVWEYFATQTSMRRLTLHLRPDGNLQEIPSVVMEHLPALEMFEVQYATIKTIHPFSFGNSTSLSKISLARNSIGQLTRNAFAHLPALDMLSLGENHITEVNRHVFLDLPELRKLYMDRNNITILHDRAFQGLHNLEELELFSNQIQVITPDTFRGLRSLQRLDLHKNRIDVIGDNTFEDLRNLTFLDLQDNSLKFLAPLAFASLSQLQQLNLQDNKLINLGPEIFNPTSSLRHLDLRANVLETLSRDTVQPLMDNFNNESMLLFLEGNIFRCDTRLGWMFGLHNTTQSRNVRFSLEATVCYLEVGTLPPRLEDQTVTPAYETTTLGIGPMTKLFALHESELPEPMVRCQSCADEEDQVVSDPPSEASVMEAPLDDAKKGRGRKSRKQKNKAQNDMAPIVSEEKLEVHSKVEPPAPVQEESRAFENGASASNPMALTLALTLALALHARPH